MKKRSFSPMGIAFIFMLLLTALVGYGLWSEKEIETGNLNSLGEDLKGAMKTVEGQLKDIRENQDSLDGKSAMLFKDLTARVSKLETAPTPVNNVHLTLTKPVQVSLIYGERKAKDVEAKTQAKPIPRAPANMLKRAMEQNQ